MASFTTDRTIIIHTKARVISIEGIHIRAQNNGRSTINGRQELLLICREARLRIILIGKNHCLKSMVNVVNKHHAILRHYHRTYNYYTEHINRTYPAARFSFDQ